MNHKVLKTFNQKSEPITCLNIFLKVRRMETVWRDEIMTYETI